MLKCIIIEDEPLAQERMKSFVLKISSLELLEVFDNGLEALVYLKSNKVDLLFLDINIGEISGIELLETIRPNAEVIVTTAYNEFALKGFELNVTDYLMKPFTFHRFFQAVERAQDNLSNKKTTVDKTFLFVKTEYRLEKIFFADIIYIEGMGDYRRIHTSDKRVMTLQTFGELQKELEPSSVIRVHKSYMVNINHIDAIERNRIKIKDQLIPISNTYKESFQKAIG